YLQKLTGHMGRAADARRCKGERSWIAFCVCDQVWNRLSRNRGVYRQDRSGAADARDRGHVADEIEIELLVERRIDRAARTDHEERVAVRRCLHHRLGADVAAGARPVVDEELLTKTLRQPLAEEPRDDVGPPTGGRADNAPDRS